jgi:hypothetical protein
MSIKSTKGRVLKIHSPLKEQINIELIFFHKKSGKSGGKKNKGYKRILIVGRFCSYRRNEAAVIIVIIR